MKSLLSQLRAVMLTAVVLFGFSLNAQTIIEQWDFEGEDVLPAGFVNIDVDQKAPAQDGWSGDAGPSEWVLAGNATPDNPSNVAVSAISWFDPLECCADDWMITPAIDLSGIDVAFLSYNFAQQQNDWPDGYRVLVSTESQDISTFNDVLFEVGSGCFNNAQSVTSDPYWDCHCDPACAEDFSSTWGSMLLDLSAYGNQEIYLAFHHNANDQYALYVDDVTVFEPVAFEANLSASAAPYQYSVAPASYFGDLEFSGTVANNGSSALTDVRLAVTVERVTDIEADPLETEIVAELDGAGGAVATVAPSESLEVSTGETYSFTEEGLYLITYNITTAEEDADLTNNSVTYPYMVNEEILGKSGLFPGFNDVTDPEDVVGFGDLSLFLWGGTDTTPDGSEGFLGYYFEVPETASMSGVQFRVGFDDVNGVGYDPGTEVHIDLIDTTGTAGDLALYSEAPYLLASSGALFDLTPDTWSFDFFSCPIELEANKSYFLRFRQVGAGDGGFLYTNYYFNSGAVTGNPDIAVPGGLLPPGQPCIHALLGEAQALEAVAINADASSLSVDFSAEATGSACDFAWTVDGEDAGSGQMLTYNFDGEGDYEVCVTATNDNGDEITSCETVSVSCALEATEVESTPSSIEIEVGNGAEPFEYEWSDGSTDNPATGLDENTEYTVTVTDANGCETTYTGSTTGCALSLDLQAISDTDVLATATDGIGDLTFFWQNLDTNESFESTGSGFESGLASGTWSVTVTDEADCAATSTIQLATGIEDIQGLGDFEMMPNPANDFVNVQFNLESAKRVSLAIHDVAGKIVSEYNEGTTNSINRTLDVSDLAAGMYLLKITVADQTVGEQLIVRR